MSLDSPESPSSRKTDRASALRSRLDAVVLSAFSEADFHKVDMRSIAESAGMSFATIYKNYGDKEGLLFAFIDGWLRELRDYVTAEMDRSEDHKEKLWTSLACYLKYYEANPKVGRVVFMTVPMQTWMKTEMFDRRGPVGTLEEVLRDAQSKGVISAEIPVQLAVDSLVGAFSRAFIMWQHRGCRYSLSEQLPALFEIFWQGLRATGRPLSVSTSAKPIDQQQ